MENMGDETSTNINMNNLLLQLKQMTLSDEKIENNPINQDIMNNNWLFLHYLDDFFAEMEASVRFSLPLNFAQEVL